MGLLSNLFGKKDQSCCDVTIEEVKKEAGPCCDDKNSDSCCDDNNPKTIQAKIEDPNTCCK